jgi:hypothetical protein
MDDDSAGDAAIFRITQYQLGLLSPSQRLAVEYDLENDRLFRDAVQPVLIAQHAHRDHVLQRRMAYRPRSEARLAHIKAAIAADVAQQQRRATPHLGRRLWTWIKHTVGIATLYGLGTWGFQLYAAELRAQNIPPASVAFVNAPLSAVMADLRHRYNIDIEACDVGYNQDRVTLTLNNAPVDSVLKQVAAQTLRWAHWHGERTVRLTPYPNLDRGVWYNVQLFLRGYSVTLGCHR